MTVIKSVYNFLKRNISLFIVLAITILLFELKLSAIIFDKNFSTIPQMSCTFVSIVLGFLGVLLSIIFTIKEKTDIINYFFESVDWRTFKIKFWISFFCGLINILLSMSLMFIDILDVTEVTFLFYIWVFSFLYFVMTQFDFYRLFFIMIEQSAGKKIDPNKPQGTASETDIKTLNKLIPKQSEESQKL